MKNKTNKQPSQILAESLAPLIAESFGEPSQEDWYMQFCRGRDWNILYRAYREVMDIPPSHVRKSRRALFIFLVKKHETKR
jgi:hypothetical protein